MKIEKKERKSLKEKLELEFKYKVIEFINDRFQDSCKN